MKDLLPVEDKWICYIFGAVINNVNIVNVIGTGMHMTWGFITENWVHDVVKFSHKDSLEKGIRIACEYSLKNTRWICYKSYVNIFLLMSWLMIWGEEMFSLCRYSTSENSFRNMFNKQFLQLLMCYVYSFLLWRLNILLIFYSPSGSCTVVRYGNFKSSNDQLWLTSLSLADPCVEFLPEGG